MKEREGGKGLSLVLRHIKAGLSEAEHWRKGRCGKVECSHTAAGHQNHLFLAVGRDGAQGGPLPLTPSKSSSSPSFYSLYVQRGEKFTFCSFLRSPPLFTKRVLEPYQFFRETRQEGFEFCTLLGLKGQQI